MCSIIIKIKMRAQTLRHKGIKVGHQVRSSSSQGPFDFLDFHNCDTLHSDWLHYLYYLLSLKIYYYKQLIISLIDVVQNICGEINHFP